MTKDTDRRREIKRLFALREAEGLSYRELSEYSEIPLGTLLWWSHRLRREDADECGFVDAGEFDVATPGDEVDGTAEVRLVHPSGLVIELRGEIADRVVGGLLQGVVAWS